jgi:UDP-N-acetyl-D-galactosamine dehydrogenase
MLKDYYLNIDCVDIHADSEEVKHEYGISLAQNIKNNDYDCVIFAVSHNEYVQGSWDLIKQYLKNNQAGVVMDVKAVLPVEQKPENIILWRP